MDWTEFFVIIFAAFVIVICLGAAIAYAGHLASEWWPRKHEPVPADDAWWRTVREIPYGYESREELMRGTTSDLSPYVAEVLRRTGMDSIEIPGETLSEYAERLGFARDHFERPRFVEQDGSMTGWPSWDGV